jgi:hypothetical protein
MKWQPSNPNKLIGGKERHMDVLLSITLLPATFVGE